MVTPLTQSPDLATGAIPPKISPCNLRNTYGLPIHCMGCASRVTVANLYAHSCESVVNLSYYLIFVTIIANLLRTCVYTLANPSRTWLHILANPLRTCSHILANLLRTCLRIFANLCESVANPSANLPYIPVYASRTLANLRKSTVHPSMKSVALPLFADPSEVRVGAGEGPRVTQNVTFLRYDSG